MIPDFQTAMLPLLKGMSNGEIYNTSMLREIAIKHFNITDIEQSEKTPNGKQLLYYNRIAWAISYLRTGKLVNSPDRGKYIITQLGKKVLDNPPDRITIRYISELNSDTKQTPTNNKNGEPDIDPFEEKTPDEMIEEGYKKINQELSKILLQNIENATPYKFEEIVVNLLIKMGYGESDFKNGEVTSKSGDEGIDGIIKEDKLGLDKIYVQAKRWKKETKIGRPEIQKFVGALDGQKRKKEYLSQLQLFHKKQLNTHKTQAMPLSA